jgi:pimeloyl-ACP methyl ester carboxylesterase/DNA-binding CsgD family transcriptional regulator
MVLNIEDGATQLNRDLVAQYGLTEKEQNVLVRLIHGESIKGIAVSSFVTENTVRTHLKSIFRKTDTKSQGALISLILTHESQVLDSYFDSDITTVNHRDEHVCDKELKLSSGHVISYCDYGPSDGRPLIVFHSGFGSRLAIPADYQAVCEKANRRIIVPDRPGLGRTMFIEGHPEKWNEQLQEFIDLLGIDEYEVLGSIIACQMAMSYAAQANHRLTRLILTSPVCLNDDSHAEYLTEILAPAAKYVKMSPQFAKEIYTLWLKAITLNLDAHYPSMLEESVGTAEKDVFIRDGVIQLLTDVFKEGARQSLDGILNEMAYCMTPLHIDLSRLTIPVEIWYGTDDKRITRKGVDVIFETLPNKTVHIREGYSEHIYYSLFEEIVS